MKCERCGKQDAVVRVTRISPDGHATTINLGNCDECQEERKYSLGSPSSIPSALQGMLKEVEEDTAELAQEAVDPRGSDLQCPSCGLEFSAYRSTGMLGCPDCYDSFEELLLPELERYHRTTRHVRTVEEVRREELANLENYLDKVRDELHEAVKVEDYAGAALLRAEAGVILAVMAEMTAKLAAADKGQS
jgi:protein arginine kinase activator